MKYIIIAIAFASCTHKVITPENAKDRGYIQATLIDTAGKHDTYLTNKGKKVFFLRHPKDTLSRNIGQCYQINPRRMRPVKE